MARRRLILLASAVGAAAILAALRWFEDSPASRGPAPPTPSDVSEERHEAGTADLVIEVSGMDRMPVAGASVRGETPGGHAEVDVFTDARGRAAVRHDIRVGSLVVRKIGYLRSWSGEQGDDGVIRFVLTPASPVDGRVAFVDGTPVPGCAIRVSNPDPYGEDLDVTTTDALGRFRIVGVPLCQPFVVEASLAGYGPVTVRQLPIEAPAPIVITLGEGAVIEGVVTGPEGAPCPTAEVTVVADGSSSPLRDPWQEGVARTTTDVSGRFRVVGVSAPAAHVIYAKKGPLVARAGPVAVAPGQTVRAELEVRPTGGLRVRLIKPDGTLTLGGSVEVVLRDEAVTFRTPTYLSRAAGAFEIDGLLPLPHEIWVQPLGFMRATRTVEIPSGRAVEVDWLLEPERTIQGKVVGTDGPLPGSTVVRLWWCLPRPNGDPGHRYIYPDGIGEDGLFDLNVPSRAEVQLTISALGFLPWEKRIGPEETGIEAALERAPHVRFRVAGAPEWLKVHGSTDTFEPDVEGNFLVPLQAAGSPCDVSFDNAGSRYVVDKLILRPGETRDVGLILPVPRGGLSGAVLDPDGKPVPGALVETTELWSAMSSQRTDRSGSFRFEDHPLARTTLLVRADGFPDLWTIVDPRGHGNVELVRGVEVRGRVIDSDGEPFPRARVSFFPLLDGGVLDEGRPREPEVDSLGRFRLLLPPGTFRPSAGFVDGRIDPMLGPAIEVVASQPKEIEIRLPWSLRLWH